MSRLIDTPLAREQMVAAIRRAPPAEKLRIPLLRDALLPQSDIIDAIAALVDDGTLDRRTLRPVLKASQGSGESTPQEPGTTDTTERLRMSPTAERRADTSEQADGPAGCDGPCETTISDAAVRACRDGQALFDLLMPEIARRGVTLTAASVEIFGVRSRLWRVKDSQTYLREPTFEKVCKWLGLQGSAAVASPPRPGSSRKVVSPVPPRAEAVDFERQAPERFVRRPSPHVATAKKRMAEGKSAGSAKSAHVRDVQLQLERNEAEAKRLTDPLEQAKTILRRAGRVVYSRVILSETEDADRYVVSGLGRYCTPEQLIAEAMKLVQKQAASA